MVSVEKTLSNIDFSNVAPALQNTVNLMLQNVNNLASANYPLSDPNGLMSMLGGTAMCAEIIANSLPQ